MRAPAFLAFLILAATTLTVPVAGKTWALLVASAKGWENYGMQADVYHAYKVLMQGGVPEEQVVVMAYDDIAASRRNPYKGQVFQSYDLQDIYAGVQIDYSKKAVTKETFQAVLKGDRDRVEKLTGRAGKVIDSGPKDNVFVFISNHGSPGHVCWWDGNDMSATELNATIAYMHSNNRYKNLVLYIDTCFAGSMFENILPDNIGAYAVTATNATSYAYSSDCASAAFSKARTCLGGLFSINWVYELQSDNRFASTLDMQFQEAKYACQGKSMALQYGDLSIAKKRQTEFFGDSSHYKKPVEEGRVSRNRRSAGGEEREEEGVIPKHLLTYQNLKSSLARLPQDSRQAQRVAGQLRAVEALMVGSDQFFTDLWAEIYGPTMTSARDARRAETDFGPINWTCYLPAVDAVKASCPKMMFTEEIRYYAGAKLGVLVNLCNEARPETVMAAVRSAARLNTLCG